MQIRRPDPSEPKTLKRLITGVLGRLTLGFVLALTLSQVSTAQPRTAEAAPLGALASGVDHVFINGTRALPGAQIFVGDEVTTDASGRARLTFLEASTLYLAGNSGVLLVQLAPATADRDEVLILDVARGVGRMVSGQDETVLVRGGGGGAFIENGTLDMVSSKGRLVTVMRQGRALCRAVNGAVLTMTDKQRACILAPGSVRPSMLSAAMKRVIDERLSIPPSTRALSQAATDAPASYYAVNELTGQGFEDTVLIPIIEPLPGEGQTQSQLLEQLKTEDG